MDALTVNSLRVIGREHGIKGYANMRKSDLLNALQSMDIVLDNLRVVELKAIAKVYGIPNYKNLQKDDLVTAIDDAEKLPEKVSITVMGPQKPTQSKISMKFTSLKKLVNKAKHSVTESVEKFTDWVSSKLPTPASKKQVKQKASRVKKNISRAFKGYERFKPRLREQKLRGAYESYIIKGVEGV